MGVAVVAGKPLAYELKLEQKYQVIIGIGRGRRPRGQAAGSAPARRRDQLRFHGGRERLAGEASIHRQGRRRRRQQARRGCPARAWKDSTTGAPGAPGNPPQPGRVGAGSLSSDRHCSDVHPHRHRRSGAPSPAHFSPARCRRRTSGDTPYVQTPQNVVDTMLEIAKVGPGDYVIDLGSGDGRMVITAAKQRGARGFGVDLDRKLVALANRNAAKAGVADRAVFYQRDLHATDVSPASVMSIYLLPEVNLMIRTRLLATLKPGTRIVSHDYGMGDVDARLPDRAGRPRQDGRHRPAQQDLLLGGAGPRRRALGVEAGRGGQARRIRARAAAELPDAGGHADGGRAQRPRRERRSDGRADQSVGGGGRHPLRVFRAHLQSRDRRQGARHPRHANRGSLPWSATRTEIWDPRHAAITTEQALKELH